VEVWASAGERLAPRELARAAERAEHLGYSGLQVPEAVHDGLLAAALALDRTSRLRVATSVLVAFARSPTTTAHAAWDLASLSGGRFELGLGSQVRANLEGRYGVAWAPPVARMREYVAAVRAIWAAWQQGRPLDVRGEHYRLARMQPFFDPGPIEHPAIPIALGAVGPAMTRLAGEVADVLVTHPTHASPAVLRERTRPAAEAGLRRAGRPRQALRIVAAPFVATGADAAAVRAERERMRGYLGFLYSTPAYAPALDVHGAPELGPHLRALARDGRWDEMQRAVGDALLEALVPAAPYAEIADLLLARYGALADAIAFPPPADPACDAAARAAIERLRG
jgi:probable F420-dependent oxidoreductase